MSTSEPVARPTEDEVPPTDEELAKKIRDRFNELCELMDQMSYRDWIMSPKIYSDDIGRWHGLCNFTKTVTL